jgi:hypothetical protein
MEPWTGAQRAFAVKAFYKYGDSFVIAQRSVAAYAFFLVFLSLLSFPLSFKNVF